MPDRNRRSTHAPVRNRCRVRRQRVAPCCGDSARDLPPDCPTLVRCAGGAAATAAGGGQGVGRGAAEEEALRQVSSLQRQHAPAAPASGLLRTPALLCVGVGARGGPARAAPHLWLSSGAWHASPSCCTCRGAHALEAAHPAARVHTRVRTCPESPPVRCVLCREESDAAAAALLATADPLGEAVKLVAMLKEHAGGQVGTHVAAFQVALQRGRLLMALSAAQRAQAAGGLSCPEAHRCTVRLALTGAPCTAKMLVLRMPPGAHAVTAAHVLVTAVLRVLCTERRPLGRGRSRPEARCLFGSTQADGGGWVWHLRCHMQHAMCSAPLPQSSTCSTCLRGLRARPPRSSSPCIAARR
jgi:hypothetical protein